MAYANISQMIARFGERELTELTDFTGAGEADAAALQSALDDAAALIDAELRAAGYAVPLALPPREIQRANLLLARCELYVTNLPESILAQCQETRAWLRAVAAGTLRLDLPAASGATLSGVVAAPSLARVYDATLWAGYDP